MHGDTEPVDLPCEEADRFGEVPAPVRHCAMSCLAAEYRGGLVEADGVAAQSRGAGSLQSRGTAADDRHGLRGHRRCHHEFKLTNAGGVDAQNAGSSRLRNATHSAQAMHRRTSSKRPCRAFSNNSGSACRPRAMLTKSTLPAASALSATSSAASLPAVATGMVTADLMAAARSTRAPGAASIGG